VLNQSVSACAWMYSNGTYVWYQYQALVSKGIGLALVGKTGCRVPKGSEPTKTDQLVSEALKDFPEMTKYQWPRKGVHEELYSFLLQADAHKVAFEEAVVPSEDILIELEDRLVEVYSRIGKARLPPKGFEQIKRWMLREMDQSVKKDSSPGCPLMIFGTTNAEVMLVHTHLIAEVATERVLRLMGPEEMPETAVELVRQGWCDPVRDFVKNEPHSQSKIEEGRLRLIASEALADQLVERYFNTYQNQLEIANWSRLPSCPGMGLDDRNLEALRLRFKQMYKHASGDVIGWDWSVKEWELVLDARVRARLSGCAEFGRGIIRRMYCLARSVFSLSDGTLIAQTIPGLMKSGSYVTSSTNSRIRVALALLLGSNWVLAMGDDCVEHATDDAHNQYARLGHPMKNYDVGGDIEFCSTHFSGENFECAAPMNWPKTLYRFFSGGATKLKSPEMREQLFYELRGSPELPRIRQWLQTHL